MTKSLPTMRMSFNKDTRLPVEKWGSDTPHSLQFSDCKFQDVHDFIVRNHYSQYLAPAGLSSYYFSARRDGVLVGACVIGHPPGGPKPVLKSPYDGKEFNRELTRLAMTDEMREAMPSPRGGSNCGTWFLNQCRLWLQHNTSLLGLISYADPEHEHTGGIYRASNWIYTGLGNPSAHLIIDGVEMHRKSAFNKFGMDSPSLLRQQGHEVEVRHAAPKHRFVYYLQKGLETYRRYLKVPFMVLVLLTVLFGGGFGAALRGAQRGLRALAKWCRNLLKVAS